MKSKNNNRKITFITGFAMFLFLVFFVTLLAGQTNNYQNISSLNQSTGVVDKLPHENLYSFFTEIEGWKKVGPIGRSLKIGGGIMARGEYNKDDLCFFIAKINIGLLGQTSLRIVESAKKDNTNEQFIQDHEINGFPATLYRDTVTKKNWILVVLIDKSRSAVLEMTFVGIQPEKCLELAKKFNWNGIKESICKVSLPETKNRLGRPL